MAEAQSAIDSLLEKLSSFKNEMAEPIERVAVEQRDAMDNLMEKLSQKDPAVSQTGIPLYGFRADFSRMDTDDERKAFLAKRVGPAGFGVDKYGQFTITPEGQKRLGLPPQDLPTIIDEPGLSMKDIADLRGSAPGVIGAVGAGMAATGAGAAVGIPLAILGAAAGKSLDETLDHIRGENLQSFDEVAGDVAIEGLTAGAGEGFFRGVLAPIGRKIMAPEGKRMTPERRELIEASRELGAKPSPTQVTKAPILGRVQGMINTIFGDPLVEGNAKALSAEMSRLGTVAGPESGGLASVGTIVKKDIGDARRALSSWSEAVTTKIDEMAKGAKVVPTYRLKDAASDIIDGLPKSVQDGKPLFMSPEAINTIYKITDDLPPYITTNQMQRVTNRLWEGVEDNTILPGVSSHDARALWKAAVGSYDDIAKKKPELAGVVKAFRSRYANEIDKFDNALVQRVMRDPKFGGSIEPESVVGSIFKKGMQTPMRRVMELLPESTKAQVRREAMEEILRSATQRTDDPLEVVFTGTNFLNALDNYSRPTLEAMFGKALTNDMYRFGSVTQFVTQKLKFSGGIVAANVALHPIANIGKLVQLNVMSRFMNSPTGFKWLTEGFRAPKTRAGAAALSRVATQLNLLTEEQFSTQAP